jgi:hypothetical protein
MAGGDGDIVRGLLMREGDVLQEIKATLARLGPDPGATPQIVSAAEEIGWPTYDADVVWDMSATGFGGVHRGPRELALWWATMASRLESYEYSVTTCEEVGDSVFTAADVSAVTCDEHEVSRAIYQVWQLREGKVAQMRAFLSEEEARAALAP